MGIGGLRVATRERSPRERGALRGAGYLAFDGKAPTTPSTKKLAREWGPPAVRCNVLVPGFFLAEQNREILDLERSASIVAHTLLRASARPTTFGARPSCQQATPDASSRARSWR